MGLARARCSRVLLAELHAAANRRAVAIDLSVFHLFLFVFDIAVILYFLANE